MSFLLSFFGFLSVLTVRIDWIKDWMDIPLHDNIENYKMLPEAKLYIDGVYVIDPDMTYERDGVDHTFFSVITTSYVKAYTIRYRVTFPNYAVTETKDIVFNIVDVNAPVFDAIPQFRIPLGEKLPDFSTGLVYHDDYDPIGDLSLGIVSYDVIEDRVGSYQIFYQISDRSGNIRTSTSIIEIYDSEPPLITQIKDLILDVYDDFFWSDYFKVTDNADPFPKVLLNLSKVDFTQIGNYEFTISATDVNGMVAITSFELAIIDRIAPTLLVRSQPVPIEVYADPSTIDFLSYIIEVDDNYDKLTIQDVNYWSDLEWDVPGTYEVHYLVSDHSQNQCEVTMKLDVVDSIKPTIEIDVPLVFPVFDPEPFYLDYLTIFDNYSDPDQLVIKIEESVKMNVIGKYPITIKVEDTFGNLAMLNTYVEIVDETAPKIMQLNDILITDFHSKDVTFYFSATDNYDDLEDLVFWIDDTAVSYETIGSYPFLVHVIDKSENESILTSEIVIADIIEPILILSDEIITMDIGESPLDFKTLIIEAYDNYDLLTADDVIITGEITYESIGRYEIIYTLTDTSLNQTQQTVFVYIDDRIPPTVSCSSVTLSVGEHFDLLQGVTASDDVSDIKIVVFPEVLDTSTPGIKEVTYIVYDMRGNFTQQIRQITVLESNETPPIEDYLPVMVVTVIGLVSAIYIYKKFG